MGNQMPCGHCGRRRVFGALCLSGAARFGRSLGKGGIWRSECKAHAGTKSHECCFVPAGRRRDLDVASAYEDEVGFPADGLECFQFEFEDICFHAAISTVT
jgi:hypothetical protein